MHDTDSFKKNIHEDYDIEEELGSGQFAVVRKIVEKETGDEFAAKYVRKKRTKASRNGMSREDIKREIEILRMVDSEKIIKVHDVYETDKEMILVMELLRGGELFDYISKKDFLTEEEAIDFTRQILLGLQHLHSRSVVHLDLKPENILLKNTRRKTIKLVDFGLARVVNENEQVREIMGTPEFVAPEVLNFDTISTATDMWALGVIAYILLSGASPFLGEDNQETFTNIIQVDYQFDEEYFAEISDEAKDFIRKLLVKHPKKRPTAHDCSRHPWVEEEVVDKKKRQRRRTTQICTFNFKRFVARKRWKMSYNKIRAMNLIAKMGIKPPPGFVAEIPPMGEGAEAAVPEPEEKPSSHEKHEKHEKHKKNQSTINRKKHKQSSPPKSTVEKTASLTLKTMDIDIGEGESAEPEPAKEIQVEPAVEGPVDYGSMTKREKRRARGQLRTHEIAKSKKEIDAKQESDSKVHSDHRQENVDSNLVVNGNDENAPAMEVEETSPVTEKSDESATTISTMQVDHKPVAKSQSAGILKKRETKGGRIPSTEDHYFVTLNAALFQQDDAFYPSGAQSTRQPVHGILKHTQSAPHSTEDNTSPPEGEPKASGGSSKLPEDVSKGSKDLSKGAEGVSKGSEEKRDASPASKFTTVVQVLSGGNVSQSNEVPGSASDAVVGLQVEKGTVHSSEKKCEKKVEISKTNTKTASLSQQNLETTPQSKNATPALKKPLGKNDNAPRSFTPPPWQRKSNADNLKTTSKPLQGVSKVSLKTNRFLSNDKQTQSKAPDGPPKASDGFGQRKFFQKEPEIKKTTAVRKNSEELKNLACEINLDDTPVSTESSVVKSRADNQIKARSDSQSKSRSSSLKENNMSINKNSNIENNKESNGTRSRSGSGRKIVSETEKKTMNCEDRESKSIENSEKISGGETEQETGPEELKSSSRRSLTEFSIRPRQNSGNAKADGFDIMLTIAPPADEPAQEHCAVSSIKTRFTSSSSSLPDPRSGLPNGRLTSLSTSDVTSHNRDALASSTGERHGVAHVGKYTPQRDFSKYLSSESQKPVKVTAVPSSNPKPTPVNWQLKRNPASSTPQSPATVLTSSAKASKTHTISPKYPTTTSTQTASSKTAAAKVSVALSKGKKSAVTSTAYIPRRSFGFSTKSDGQSEVVVKPLESDDTPKLNNNDESKKRSHSSYASDRSASSASSDELSLRTVTTENNALSRNSINEQAKNPEISSKMENHSEVRGKLSPHASPVLERKWKATLVLPKESEKKPLSKDGNIRISSTNAPRKNKFTNVRSMWEGK